MIISDHSFDISVVNQTKRRNLKMKKQMSYGYSAKTVCRKIFCLVAAFAVLLCVFATCLVSCNVLGEDPGDETENDAENDTNGLTHNKISLVLPMPDDTEPVTEDKGAENESVEIPSQEDALPIVRKSLSYVSNGDGTCMVCSIGSVTDVCIVIPERSPGGDIVTGVSPMAFYGDRNIVAVEIPKSVKEIGGLAFADCPKLVYISVDDGNAAFCDRDGILYDKSGTELICCPDAFGADRINISDKVTKIHYMALYNCSAIKMIDYGGTREAWERIAIEEKNYVLISASVSFGNK